jgi:hypothetical protein
MSLDDDGDEEEQENYCDIHCFEKSWQGKHYFISIGKFANAHDLLNEMNESEHYNVYENEHIIRNSQQTVKVKDLLSEDFAECCIHCEEQLN